MSKRLNALQRIARIEYAFNEFIKGFNRYVATQLILGAALDVLIEKGVITQEELNERANRNLTKTGEETEEAGEQTSSGGEETV